MRKPPQNTNYTHPFQRLPILLALFASLLSASFLLSTPTHADVNNSYGHALRFDLFSCSAAEWGDEECVGEYGTLEKDPRDRKSVV